MILEISQRGTSLFKVRLIDQHFIQPLQCVADVTGKANVHLEIMGQPGGADLKLYDRRIGFEWGHVRMPDLFKERATNQHDQIAIAHSLVHRCCVRPHPSPEVRMISRKRKATADEFHMDASAGFLGQLHQGISRAFSDHIVTRDEYRLAAATKEVCHLRQMHLCDVGTLFQGACGSRGDIRLLLHHIDGQSHEHRPGRMLVGDLEGPGENRAHLIGRLNLHTPLGHRFGHRGQIVTEQRVPQAHACILGARRDDHWGIVLECAIDRANRIAQTRRNMHVDHRSLPRRLGEKVAGADGHALVQMHDVFDVRVIHQAIQHRALCGARVAEDFGDAVKAKRFHEDLTAAHRYSPG